MHPIGCALWISGKQRMRLFMAATRAQIIFTVIRLTVATGGRRRLKTHDADVCQQKTENSSRAKMNASILAGSGGWKGRRLWAEVVGWQYN